MRVTVTKELMQLLYTLPERDRAELRDRLDSLKENQAPDWVSKFPGGAEQKSFLLPATGSPTRSIEKRVRQRLGLSL